MRVAAIVIILVLMTTLVYTAAMSGTAKSLGGGIDSVPHCQVSGYNIAALDTISTVNATVECSITGSYTVSATVTSGASSGSGQTAASLAADTPQSVSITISPSVTITSSTYSVELKVKR